LFVNPEYRGFFPNFPLKIRGFIKGVSKITTVSPRYERKGLSKITPGIEEKRTDKPMVFNPNLMHPGCGPTLMARGNIGALRLAAARHFLFYLSFYLFCERCVSCVGSCIQKHLFVFFLLFRRIQ